ncbi:MAG: DivIVA domain-containing protein [Bdellovibrionota bacterium]
MKIVPIDIIHKSFKRKMAGFDPDEVSQFLRAVAEELESAIHERNRMQEALREKELQLLEYKDRDRILKDTITTAQQMSERIKSDSDREAQMILQDAHHKAEMIVRDSRDSLKSVYKDLNDLKKIKLQFEANLKAMVQTHLDLLGRQEQYYPSVPDVMPEKKQAATRSVALERNTMHRFDLK